MDLYLTVKLVPFGSSVNVVNETDLDTQASKLKEERNLMNV
jgi:hypothetical protein